MKSGKDYISKKTAKSYERDRFAGAGGEYVDAVEKEAIHEMVGGKKGKILDLASGTGRMAKTLGTNGNQIIGVDLSFEMLLEAKKESEYALIQGDALALPFADGTFNMVIASRFLYFLESPEGILREVRRILKAEGLFILSTDNCYSSRGILNLWFRLLNLDRGIHLTSVKKLSSLLRRSGFKTLEVKQKFAFPLNSYKFYPTRALYFFQFLDQLVPSFCRVMIFIKCKRLP